MGTKKLKFWSIVLLTINSIIGTGIFLSPGKVAKQVGDIAPLIFLAAAIFAAILAITFASASKYVNKNGAGYAYAKAAFGENVGLFIGITRYISASIAWGVLATAVVKVSLNIMGFDKENLYNVGIGFFILMFVLLIINFLGTKVLEIVNNISTIGKILALLITIVAGIVIIIMTGENHMGDINLLKSATGENVVPTLTVTTVVTGIIAAFYAFTGFESVASGASDMEKPEKNLPRAIPIAIGIIAIIYIGIIVVSLMIDPINLINTDRVVALSAVYKNPIVSNLIVYGALISMFGINVAASFHTPRIFEAMARENQVPKFFDYRLKNGLPIRAFIITAAIAIIIPWVFNFNVGGIIVISAISRFTQFIIVPLGVIIFYLGKSKEKIIENAKKSFVLDVIVPIIALILTILLLYQFDWVGQFSTTKDGIRSLNWYAIVAMIVGYIILPLLGFIYKSFIKKKVK